MNSSFVNLSSYCILEFRATPLGDTNPPLLSSGYYLVDNKNVNTLQIYNTDGYSDVTHNSRGLSVVSLGGSKVIYNDINIIPIYSAYDPNITETAINTTYSTNLVMDTIRFHFASGFNFTEVEELIVGAKHKLNDLRQIQIVTILLNAATASTIFTYNNHPLFIANTIYDRYIDVKIPAISWLDQDFTQFGSASFEYAITQGIGFIKNAPITVFLAEASWSEYYAPNNVTYDQYQLVNYYEGSVAQINRFDSLGCIIQEAADGDYIEFFATWNGAFPDALINVLNDSGPDQNWIISHQLQVYEQIGTDLVPSGTMQMYQDDRFDEVLTYRPILRDAGYAVSMSIDYTVRLVNTKNGDQVIKTAALSIINPNKYGKKLLKINLPDGPQSMKVYNKIVQKNFEMTNLFTPKSTQVAVKPIPAVQTVTVTETKVETKVIQEYIPVKQMDIQISAQNALNAVGKETANVIYGQGRIILPIDPVDNYIKFTVYEVNPVDATNYNRLNLNNNSDFKLNFGKTAKYSFSTVTDTKLTSPSRGEIAFRIPKDQAHAILDMTDTQFFLTLVSKIDSTETLFYTGKWVSSVNYDSLLISRQDNATNAAKDKQLAELRATVTKLTSANEELAKQKTEVIASAQISQTQSTQTINAAAATKPPTSQIAKQTSTGSLDK
jgi:hypothetical protein